MFERILVPLDGSKVGEAAIPVIKRLLTRRASGTKVDVHLLAVITLLRHWVVVGEAGLVHRGRTDTNQRQGT
jgi:hypothetical protein